MLELIVLKQHVALYINQWNHLFWKRLWCLSLLLCFQLTQLYINCSWICLKLIPLLLADAQIDGFVLLFVWLIFRLFCNHLVKLLFLPMVWNHKRNRLLLTVLSLALDHQMNFQLHIPKYELMSACMPFKHQCHQII